MMLKSISARFLKNQSFRHELSPVTMFIGPNAVGKTARLDAFRLALLGYAPGLGANNEKVFQLSGSNEMAVEAVFGPDASIQRTWTRSGDSIKASKKVVGGIPELPVVLLDPSEYFGLSADKRTEYVFNRVKMDAEKFSAKSCVNRVKRLPAATEHHAAALKGQINEMEFSFQCQDGETTQEWLATRLEKLTGEIKDARAAVDRMVKTVAGMTELELKNATELSESVPSLNTKIAELEKEAQELALQKERLEQLQKRMQAVGTDDPVAKHLNLSEWLKVAEASMAERQADPAVEWSEAFSIYSQTNGELLTVRNTLAQLRASAKAEEAKQAQRTEWEKQLNELADPAVLIHGLQIEISELERTIGGYQSDYLRTASEVNKWSARIAVLATEREAAKQRIEVQEKRLAGFLTQDHCPTCKANTPGWQDKVKADFAHEIDVAKTAIVQLTAEQDAATVQWTDAERACAAWKAKDAEHQTRQDALKTLQNRLGDARLAQGKVDKVQTALSALGPFVDHSGAILDCEKNLVYLTERLTAAAARVAELELAKNVYQENRQTAANELATAKANLKRLEEVIAHMTVLEVESAEDLQFDLTDVKGQIANIGAELPALYERKNRAMGSQQDLIRQRQAETERNKAEAELEILKLVRDTIKEFRDEMVTAGWGPILERANAIANPILKSPLEVKDNVLGRRDGERWISVETFSGTEQAVTYAALCVALSVDSPFKLVLCDEMGRMDRAHKTAFIVNILKLQKEGVIHQFCGVDVSDECYVDPDDHSTGTIDGLTIIDLK